MRNSIAEQAATANGYRTVKVPARSNLMLAILAKSQLSKVAVCTSPPIISRVLTNLQKLPSFITGTTHIYHV